MLILSLLFANALAHAEILDVNELKAHPCASQEERETTCDCRAKKVDSHKILNAAKAEKARVARELAMFRKLDELQKFGSKPPDCLSVTECQRLIKSVQADMKDPQDTLDSYSKPALAKVKAEFEDGGPSEISDHAREILTRAANYLRVDGLQAWIAGGMKDPKAHAPELALARSTMDSYMAKPWSTAREEAQLKKDSDLITTMQAHVQAYQADLARKPSDKGDAAALKAEEAKWSKFLEPQTKMDGYQQCDLSVAERAAIWWYTDLGSKTLNEDLRVQKKDGWKDVLDVMDHGLQKLRKVEGTVYRGVTLPKDEEWNYEPTDASGKPHAPVLWRAFTSTTADSREHFSGAFQFEIRALNGRWIGPLSSHPTEKEVLLPTDTWIQVKEKVHGKFVVEEVEKPN